MLDIVYGVHESLRGTRGCAGAFCKIDTLSGEIEFIGIGNITARINTFESIRMISRDGILGLGDIRPKQHLYHLHVGECIVMYSDGVKEFFDFDECRDIFKKMQKKFVRIF